MGIGQGNEALTKARDPIILGFHKGTSSRGILREIGSYIIQVRDLAPRD